MSGDVRHYPITVILPESAVLAFSVICWRHLFIWLWVLFRCHRFQRKQRHFIEQRLMQLAPCARLSLKILDDLAEFLFRGEVRFPEVGEFLADVVADL